MKKINELQNILHKKYKRMRVNYCDCDYAHDTFSIEGTSCIL